MQRSATYLLHRTLTKCAALLAALVMHAGAPAAQAATLATPAAATELPSPTQPTGLSATHRSGQTFLTWTESVDANVLHYRIYRSDQPIDDTNIGSADLLYEVIRGSGNFYADRYVLGGVWGPRYFERFVIEDFGQELAAGTELLVWTLGEEDLGITGTGDGYYAVSAVDDLGVENLADFSADNTLGPIAESIDTPRPVLAQIVQNVGAHIYIQYQDLRWFNETISSPNSLNDHYGLDDQDIEITQSVNYAFTYGMFPPDTGFCSPAQPTYGISVFLHSYGGQAQRPFTFDPDPLYCNVFRLYPIDISNTWWFGNGRDNDYRTSDQPQAGDAIVNYTEQRVLQMIDGLLNDPTFGSTTDPNRVYAYGTSMGGSGALAFALRYPNVFAATHAGQPMTSYLQSGASGGTDWVPDVRMKLGDPSLALPIEIDAEHPYQAHLETYEGTPAWDWQDHQATIANLGNREVAPFGIDHGTLDTIIEWQEEGAPTYALLNDARLCWAGEVIESDHLNSNLATLPVPLERSLSRPFWNFSAVRDETVPGFRNATGNSPLPPVGPGLYNAHLDWSASWDPIDMQPTDTEDEWAMSIRSTSVEQFVDVIPRRTQAFKPEPGESLRWENVRVSNGSVIDSGTIQVDTMGLATIPNAQITTGLNRMRLLRSLVADVPSVSLTAGGNVQFDLRQGADRAGMTYFLVGTAAGTTPGIQLNPFFKLPLNYDDYTFLTITQPNTFLANSFATLDGDGRGSATLTVPPAFDPTLAGVVVHHAFVVYDLPTSTDVVGVSNPVQFELVP